MDLTDSIIYYPENIQTDTVTIGKHRENRYPDSPILIVKTHKRNN